MTAGRQPLPFEEALAGMVEDAGWQVPWRGQISQRAFASAQLELLRLLTGICGWPLLAAFTVFRGDVWAKDDLYRDFVLRLRQGALEPFFAELPVLSQLAAQCKRDWTDATRDFLSRLESDRSGLAHVFGCGATGEIVDLDIALSDRHRGRTVLAATFASGGKLVYKPRDMALERAWFDLLDWLNHRGAPVDQRVVKVWERPGYGWAEWVAHEPCHDGRDVRDYFLRAGALQCLLYVLHGADAHMGNLIAAGACPVLVDAECLVQPRKRGAGDSDPDQQTILDLAGTGLLPLPRAMRGRNAELSGLLGDGGESTDYRVPLWEKPGSDAIGLRFVPASLLPQNNAPMRDGKREEVAAYTAEFVRGFKEMHRCLEDRRPALLAADGPVGRMFSGHARVLLGSTRDYVSLISRSLRPRYLRDRAQRSDMLREALSDGRPTDLVEAEATELERLDIPYFTAQASDVALSAPGNTLIGDYFDAAGEDVVRARFAGLSGASLDRRCSLLRILFALSSLGE